MLRIRPVRDLPAGWRRRLPCGDRRGTTAVIFALSILPILGMIGLAVDLGLAVSAKSRLDLAAETAIVAGVMAAVNTVGTDPNNYLTVGQTIGAQRFLAQAGTAAFVAQATPGWSMTRSGITLTGSIAWTARYTTQFGKLFGVPSVGLSGKATATATIGTPYVDIIIMFDNSTSMELPSTKAGIARMEALTKSSQFGTCAFACHYSATKDSSGNFNDTYGTARKNGIELRFDVIIAALQKVITTVTSLNTLGTYRLAIYTFDSKLNNIFPLNSNLSAAAAAVNGISIPLTNGKSDTNFAGAMTTLNATLTAAGDGTTASAPRKYLIILTDGVEDAVGNLGTKVSDRTVTVFNSAKCTPIKAKGITTSIIYTTYLPFPEADSYVMWVAPISSQIEPALQACASSLANYTSAADGPAIAAAIQKMLTSALAAPARLTQ